MPLNLSKNNTDYAFQVQMPVRISDLVGGMHVANHMLIAYITEAHMQFIAALGFPALRIETSVPINKDLEICYKSEAKYNDVMNIALMIESMGQKDYQIAFHVTNKETKRTICQARMTMVFLDTNKQQRVDVPKLFVEACRSCN